MVSIARQYLMGILPKTPTAAVVGLRKLHDKWNRWNNIIDGLDTRTEYVVSWCTSDIAYHVCYFSIKSKGSISNFFHVGAYRPFLHILSRSHPYLQLPAYALCYQYMYWHTYTRLCARACFYFRIYITFISGTYSNAFSSASARTWYAHLGTILKYRDAHPTSIRHSCTRSHIHALLFHRI